MRTKIRTTIMWPPLGEPPCSNCSGGGAVNRFAWIGELDSLLVRFSCLGVTPDIAAMDWCELWGLHRYLKRLAEDSI
jgi:hypothetical protein